MPSGGRHLVGLTPRYCLRINQRPNMEKTPRHEVPSYEGKLKVSCRHMRSRGTAKTSIDVDFLLAIVRAADLATSRNMQHDSWAVLVKWRVKPDARTAFRKLLRCTSCEDVAHNSWWHPETLRIVVELSRCLAMHFSSDWQRIMIFVGRAFLGPRHGMHVQSKALTLMAAI